MKRILTILFLLFTITLQAQTVSNYFERIRNNAAELTAFFSQMPKGGDLHHHYSGSVYAESFFDNAIEYDLFINRSTLEIRKEKPADDNNWTNFSSLKKEGLLPDYKQRLLRQWSAKDYNESDYPSHRQFFESFGHFGLASNYNIDKGLLEIKKRAKVEKVSYIETMFETIKCDKDIKELFSLNKTLRDYQQVRQQVAVQKLLDSLYKIIQKKNVDECAVDYAKNFLEKLHSSLAIDDSAFTMRYQTYVLRFMEPVQLFKNIIVAFEAANSSPLIVGVNIVAPEHDDISMNDYWLHMQMFNYCHTKFPTVKYSMHAGELTLGLVKPEELTWHITSAVYDAKANRIGHGVDVAYEKEPYALLNYMRKKNIPVEINLYSNEFILKVKEDRHPIMLYKNFKVPIVISTDDAGVLRSSLIEQYVLLAKRYKQIKYADIKQFVYNSIQYSFIKEPMLKQKIKSQLDKDFINFEKSIMAIQKQ
ncbi:MAG: Adenosine deaminase [Chitinophagaceae bacterium]|nr:Adenosine deaminase [Chitinophagaceae bacterium]